MLYEILVVVAAFTLDSIYTTDFNEPGAVHLFEDGEKNKCEGLECKKGPVILMPVIIRLFRYPQPEKNETGGAAKQDTANVKKEDKTLREETIHNKSMLETNSYERILGSDDIYAEKLPDEFVGNALFNDDDKNSWVANEYP